MYATLVTLDGSQDGTEQHQLVTVPSDLNGQQIDLSAFANFAGQNGITVSDLQVNVQVIELRVDMWYLHVIASLSNMFYYHLVLF